MDTPRVVVLVLGIWIGASLTLFTCVAYSFRGIDGALDANPRLRAKAGFDPANPAEKKASVLWVYASELNRAYFYGWNRAQLVLACVALFTVLARLPRPWLVLWLLLAAGVVLVLTFYLSPEITRRGRELDFLPRDETLDRRRTFEILHEVYRYLEVAKVLLLGLAAGDVLRSGRQSSLGETR